MAEPAASDLAADQGGPTSVAVDADSPRRHRAVVAAVAAIVLVALIGGGFVVAARAPSGADHLYVIPPGTQAAISAGEDVEVIPAELHLAPNDELTITNHDSVAHAIGLFTVRPDETVNYRFANPGVFRGACTVHPTGSLTIYVA